MAEATVAVLALTGITLIVLGLLVDLTDDEGDAPDAA